MRTLLVRLLPTLLLLACGKGELDPGTLKDNPFDPDYAGPPVFQLDTTYARSVSTPSGPVQQQVIAFRVRSELFLSRVQYSVRVEDTAYGLTEVIDPDPIGSSHFNYVRLGWQVGVPVCLRLRLFNDQSAARAEEICATLQ